MRIIIPTLFCVICFFSACRKETIAVAPALDKEIRIQFPVSPYYTNATTFQSLPESSNLLNFNKQDYPNVNLITFNVVIRAANAKDSVYARLFNVTDNVEVANSTIVMSRVIAQQKSSTNIYFSLPNKNIDLAIQVKSFNNSTIYIEEPFLVLRRP